MDVLVTGRKCPILAFGSYIPTLVCRCAVTRTSSLDAGMHTRPHTPSHHQTAALLLLILLSPSLNLTRWTHGGSVELGSAPTSTSVSLNLDLFLCLCPVFLSSLEVSGGQRLRNAQKEKVFNF